MKYSIILPYIDRLYQLEKTLSSFLSLYKRNDFEVIVVEDDKTADSLDLEILVKCFFKWIKITHKRYYGRNTYNPAPLYNTGVDNSFGEYIIISSPECYHVGDILSGLDKEFDEDPDAYVVCACKNLNANDEPISWFQHSKYRNALYHFCSAISRKQYLKIGGFDEEFSEGYCFDDDDFKSTIIENGIRIVARDDLLVHHQHHKKTPLGERNRLWIRNKALYERKHGPYVQPPSPVKITRRETV